MNNIKQLLIISTSHVTKTTRNKITSGDFEEWGPQYRNDHGWIFAVTDLHCFDSGPADVYRAAEYAKKMGCQWLLFDRDGDIQQGLPTFMDPP